MARGTRLALNLGRFAACIKRFFALQLLFGAVIAVAESDQAGFLQIGPTMSNISASFRVVRLERSTADPESALGFHRRGTGSHGSVYGRCAN
jgi:hypothetical protein